MTTATSHPTELLKALGTDGTLTRTRLLQEAVSFTPTRHRVSTASGSVFYTHCTLDTLLLPLVLNEDVHVETTPPNTARPIILDIQSGQVSGPEGTVISVPIRVDAGPVQQRFCPYSNAFVDREAYDAWAAQSPVSTQGLSLEDAQAWAVTLVSQLTPESDDQDTSLGCC